MYKHRQPETGACRESGGNEPPYPTDPAEEARMTDKTRKGVMPVAHMEERRD